MNNKSMKYEEAIEILRQHQAWRKGGGGEMIDPSILTEAIDLITLEAKRERPIKDRRKAHAIKR